MDEPLNLVLFSGTDDKLQAAAVLTAGAAALGKPVNVFLQYWALDAFRADGLECLELLHQVDNLASCRVAEKSGYQLDSVLPPAPPSYPLDGHLHIRRA